MFGYWFCDHCFYKLIEPEQAPSFTIFVILVNIFSNYILYIKICWNTLASMFFEQQI